ncbi:MAG: NAD-dependent epimerase/dehydratase family protein, partial [Candidatus Ryanbacteria bacterium]|nr:NAD-dependent epimerase/dehydratase family protein [Candidatus Ryanbacteria bacterium]
MIKHQLIEEDIKRIIHVLGDEARALEGKTLLISGGSGFLGSYFVATVHALNKIFKKPCRVISVDNYITGSRENLIHDIKDDAITFIEGDISKPLNNKEELAGSVDYIVHAAGLASPFYYKKYPLETIEAAISGSKNLLELAREKKPTSFLFFSSSEIYGDPDPKYVPTPETYKGYVACIGPRACYDESKRLSETLCSIYHERFGVPVKMVRPFNVYGPGMKIDDYRVLPAFANRGLKGES